MERGVGEMLGRLECCTALRTSGDWHVAGGEDEDGNVG